MNWMTGISAGICCFALLVCNCCIAYGDYQLVLSEQLNQYCDWRLTRYNMTRTGDCRSSCVGKAGPRGARGPSGNDGKVNYTVVKKMTSAFLSGISWVRICDQKLVFHFLRCELFLLGKYAIIL